MDLAVEYHVCKRKRLEMVEERSEILVGLTDDCAARRA